MPLCTAKKTGLRRRAASLLGRIALAGSVLALSACADYWPDELDPNDWYASAMGEEPAPESDLPVPGEDDDYPNLAEVPDAPVNVSTPEEIDAVAEALAADLANAQYSSSLQRVDDETTPAAMPAAPPKVVEEEAEVTVIEPGGEIEIAEAQTVTPPAPEVVEEEIVVVEEPASPPAETAVAAVETEETLVIAPAPQAEPMESAIAEPAESRVETETIVDESGELVGTVTRVVASREVVVVEGVETMAAPAPEMVEEEIVVVDEPAVESAMVEETVVAAPAPAAVVGETVAVETMADDETLVVAPGASDGSGESLVAKSERSATDNVVVVPEYVGEALGEAEMAAVETEAEIETMSEAEAELQAAVAAETLAMEPVPDEPAATTAAAVEETTVVDDDDGELVGTVTRTVTVEEEVVTAPESEPAAVATNQAIVVEQEVAAGQVTGATVAPAQQLDFDDLFAASGPTAGTATQPLVVADAPTTGGGDAAFTSAGAGMAQTLAAIIRFGNGSSALGAAERDIIRQIATIHAQRGGIVRLVGHASRTASGMETSGQQLANFNISLDRGAAGAAARVRPGGPRAAGRVEAAGDNAATSLDAAGDRRVDIFIGA